MIIAIPPDDILCVAPELAILTALEAGLAIAIRVLNITPHPMQKAVTSAGGALRPDSATRRDAIRLHISPENPSQRGGSNYLGNGTGIPTEDRVV
jgi:hypothetical protein